MGTAKLKQVIVVLVLGIVAGTINLAVMEELENSRSLNLLIFSSITASFILTFIYYQIAGKKLNSIGFLASSAAVFFIAVLSFTVLLGLALMSEYSAYLFVEKAEKATNCVVLTEEDLSRLPFLEMALNKAEKTGRVVVKIDADDVKVLKGIYGKCVVYRGEKYAVNVAVT